MLSVFTINRIVIPKSSQSHGGRGFPRLTRPSLQSFYPDAFYRAESRIARVPQGFQRLTRLPLQFFGLYVLMQFFGRSYCVNFAFYGCFRRKGDDFAGILTGIDAQVYSCAITTSVFYADQNNQDLFSASLAPKGSSGIADNADSHKSVDYS